MRRRGKALFLLNSAKFTPTLLCVENLFSAATATQRAAPAFVLHSLKFSSSSPPWLSSPVTSAASCSIMPTTRSGRSTSSSNSVSSASGDASTPLLATPEGASFTTKGDGNDDNGNHEKGASNNSAKRKINTEGRSSTSKQGGEERRTTRKSTRAKSEITSTPKTATIGKKSAPALARTETETVSARKLSTAATKRKKATGAAAAAAKTPKRRKATTKKKSSPSSRKRQRIEPGSLQPPTEDWDLIYALVKELRADKTAPLDYDGGQALPERHRGEKVYRYQVLTALMLSSQTKDAVVGDAMRKLQNYGLDVEQIRDIDVEELKVLIGKVGFYNNKAKYMKRAAEILIDEYGGDIPSTADEMMKLPGVGPKMAYIIESIVFNKSTGIGVDTHMHRIFNDLKWVKSKTPEQTREQLEGWLPKDRWGELNALFVGFGQESQQQKEKILKKALACSQPSDALKLLKKVGMDVKKEGEKYGLYAEIEIHLNRNKNSATSKEEQSIDVKHDEEATD